METYRDKFLQPQFDNIPASLLKMPWAVWRAEPRPNKPGKYNKAPRCPHSDRKIGADKPELFGSFEEAKSAYQNGPYTGVGILLIGNGIVGVDLDEVKTELSNNAALSQWLNLAIKCGAYCEYSPSKAGVRLFVLGDALPDDVMRKHGNLEIYDDQRFLTVTGHFYARGEFDA